MRHIALVGDFNPQIIAHQAIPKALELAGSGIDWTWVATRDIDSFGGFDAVWCVPASPYENTAGALAAIRWARETGKPFLGTCGGYQHALLEYAANVWGIEAWNAETDPDQPHPVIAPLACSMVEVGAEIVLVPGSRLAEIYGGKAAVETYRCRFGLSREYADRLGEGDLRVGAWNGDGDVQAIELRGHSFFIGTGYQPERSALKGEKHPIIQAFVEAIHRD